MRKNTKTIWSLALSIIMVFLLIAQPHAVHAATNDTLSEQMGTKITADESETGSETTPEGVEEPEFVVALAPVAAAAFNSTVVNFILAIATGWFVGTYSQQLFTGAINDKKATSVAQYSYPSYTQIYDSYPDYAGFTLGTKATKHMEQNIVTDVHHRIKNYSNDTNTRVYSSTPENTEMVVIDIVSPLKGTVNRHLGNFLSGEYMMDPNIGNEYLDLAGYSLFIISNKETEVIFHAHFTPTRLRDREIEYNRYVGQFDVQVYPNRSQNKKYLKTDSNYGWNKSYYMANRGLVKDTKNNISVIPYK